jgi:hypothetical protein
MDHEAAVRLAAVEKYLLGELPPSDRDEFEEHFFGCAECAEDLRTTATFLDAAKREFKRTRAERTQPVAARASRFGFLWRPAIASPAFALLLLVLVYQNAVVFPRLTREITQLHAPEILASVSLIGGNSRGGAIPAVTVAPGASLLVTLDIPTAERYSSYSAALLDPSGTTVWNVPVSTEQARDTLALRIPAHPWQEGEYSVVVRGNVNAVTEPTQLARYRFVLRNAT